MSRKEPQAPGHAPRARPPRSSRERAGVVWPHGGEKRHGGTFSCPKTNTTITITVMIAIDVTIITIIIFISSSSIGSCISTQRIDNLRRPDGDAGGGEALGHGLLGPGRQQQQRPAPRLVPCRPPGPVHCPVCVCVCARVRACLRARVRIRARVRNGTGKDRRNGSMRRARRGEAAAAAAAAAGVGGQHAIYMGWQ